MNSSYNNKAFDDANHELKKAGAAGKGSNAVYETGWCRAHVLYPPSHIAIHFSVPRPRPLLRRMFRLSPNINMHLSSGGRLDTVDVDPTRFTRFVLPLCRGCAGSIFPPTLSPNRQLAGQSYGSASFDRVSDNQATFKPARKGS